MPIRPGLLLLAGGGGVLLWSGIKGKSVTSVFRQLIGGDPPTAATNANAIVQSPTSGGSEPSNSPAGDTGAATGNAAANQATAKVLAVAMGYPQWITPGTQWNDWVSLWNQESGWNQYAVNRQSGAYGIPQALPPTKLPAAGQASGGSSPSAQITWGIQYIAATYGSPSAAWDHEVANGWY
jgi:resuscitation-promoting factor RpfB